MHCLTYDLHTFWNRRREIIFKIENAERIKLYVGFSSIISVCFNVYFLHGTILLDAFANCNSITKNSCWSTINIFWFHFHWRQHVSITYITTLDTQYKSSILRQSCSHLVKLLSEIWIKTTRRSFRYQMYQSVLNPTHSKITISCLVRNKNLIMSFSIKTQKALPC